MSAPDPLTPRVRVIEDRTYVSLGGAEHGMEAAEAIALCRAIAARHGLAVVPVEPTMETLRAMDDALPENYGLSDVPGAANFHIFSLPLAEYRAIIDVAKGEGK